jgi:hypothetical protein
MPGTATLTPQYYRVSYSGTTPTNWNTATGTTASGGLDSTHPERYNRRIRISGTAAAPTVTAGNKIKLNNVVVTFSSTTLASVISDINALTQQHGVFAYEEVSTYLTLANAPTFEGESIWIANESGTGLVDLGLTADVYTSWPNVLGTVAPTLPSAADTLDINGVTITITDPGGGVTLASVVANINAVTAGTDVVAYASADRIQLAGVDGQPFLLADGTAGIIANLGFSTGVNGGTPTTLTQSLDKERATMRWDQTVANLGLLISPVFLGEIVKTGSGLTVADAQLGTVPVANMSWTVGYDRPSYLYMEDELNPGTYLSGAACIKRLIARALHSTMISNQEIFDPTITTFGDHCARSNPTQIVEVTAAQVNATLATVEANLSVSLIANV